MFRKSIENFVGATITRDCNDRVVVQTKSPSLSIACFWCAVTVGGRDRSVISVPTDRLCPWCIWRRRRWVCDPIEEPAFLSYKFRNEGYEFESDGYRDSRSSSLSPSVGNGDRVDSTPCQ